MSDLRTGVERIAAERQRQTEVEGWDADHDNAHRTGQLARAAALYAIPQGWRNPRIDGIMDGSISLLAALWPRNWASHWWKPTPDNRIRELEKAGALVAAEIDRLLRKALTPGDTNE
jgi:hypothetical protein